MINGHTMSSCGDHFDPPFEHYPKKTMLNSRGRMRIDTAPVIGYIPTRDTPSSFSKETKFEILIELIGGLVNINNNTFS